MFFPTMEQMPSLCGYFLIEKYFMYKFDLGIP